MWGLGLGSRVEHVGEYMGFGVSNKEEPLMGAFILLYRGPYWAPISQSLRNIHQIRI